MSRSLHRFAPRIPGPPASPPERDVQPRRRVRHGVVLAAVAALALAACGGADSSESGGGDGDATGADDSPLAQLLGFDTSTAEQRAQQLEVQQSVAQCMQDEGWEYTPVDVYAQQGDMDAEWEEMTNDPEGYGEKYGYGVVRSYETQGDTVVSDIDDPNMDYVNTLTPDETEAYYETLYGVPPEYEEGMEQDFSMPPLEEQGCWGRGTLAVFGEGSPMTDTEVQNRLNELFMAAEDSPEIAAARDVWSACMREKDPSYDWSTPEEVSTEFWDRLNVLQGYGPMEDLDGDMTVTAETFDAGGMPDEIDEADLEALRQDELRTWRDDWDCQQEADIDGVRRDTEQRIVDELLDEFPELAGS